MRIVAVMNFYTASCPESTPATGTERRLFRHDAERLGRVGSGRGTQPRGHGADVPLMVALPRTVSPS